MAKKQFKAESKKLLDMMINSIYTHKEIFLRELISNSSDAIDKLYYLSLTDKNLNVNRNDLSISLELDKENRTIKVIDNGIGMTKDDLEKNLGTIAQSGSLNFKNENEAKEDIDIIGQFGVGFYSAFMVSDDVAVISKSINDEQGWKWESSGADGYTIKEDTKSTNGTEITLHLKEKTDDENFDSYLEEYTIRTLVKKYSDYIRYPITMMVEKSKLKEGTEDEQETYSELETLNSMVPIWKKQKKNISDEDYNNFYKEKFYEFSDPAKVIHTSVEGMSSYDALLFIPSKAAANYYSKDFEKGLQLYSSGVLIMDKCADLLPDYYSFVKGLVDSQDLSLNISREMLQHDRQLKAIASRLEKKITSELLKMQEKETDKYEEFFKNFGMQIKYGVYDNFGMHKDELKDLLMFYSSSQKKMITLKKYVEHMNDDQKFIYFASGQNVNKIDKLPQTEVLKDKGYEILYLTDDIDEFTLQVLHDYDGKEFKSVSADDLDMDESKEEKEIAEKQIEDNKELLALVKETLGDKVTDVRISTRLKTHPVCLTTKGGVSLEMEKVINSLPTDQEIKAERILEINSNHPIMKTLSTAYNVDKDQVKTLADILYNQALLIEGMSIEDPVAYSNEVCKMLSN